ncbi:hypothetical protein LR48_Vigan10g109500 [Vigna angularis]|uniref:Uncharacterized protein n=1 Tax=Phaseolus angularis TaxID=3914 RepID=A0A0L9VJP2_PHAAN|nr:hypothetical protein LR48_Vigan10g109500 [Vigna angularis]
MLAAADEAKPAAALDKAKQPPTADEAILPPPAADEAIPQAANEALESGDFSKFFSSLFLSSFLITMVSLSTTTPFLPFTAQNASTRIPPPNTFRYTNHCHRYHQKVVCACIAPPQNFKSQDSSPINFNGLHKSEQLSAARDQDDDSDVLIECRDMYKSFGEKKILNGVSFKGEWQFGFFFAFFGFWELHVKEGDRARRFTVVLWMLFGFFWVRIEVPTCTQENPKNYQQPVSSAPPPSMNPSALSSRPPSTLTPPSLGGSLLAADPHRGPVVQAPFLDVVNISPAFRGHYGAFSPTSSLPALDYGLHGSPMDEAGDERLAWMKQAANDQRELDGRREHYLDHVTTRQQRGGSGGDVVDAAGREQQQGNNGEARRSYRRLLPFENYRRLLPFRNYRRAEALGNYRRAEALGNYRRAEALGNYRRAEALGNCQSGCSGMVSVE